MIACLDVQYAPDVATASYILLENWQSPQPCGFHLADLENIQDYKPGSFFLRELPALLAVAQKIRPFPEVFVVDAYCDLDPGGRAGLGAMFYEALNKTVPVVGVAKRRFYFASQAVEILCGASKSPLFITACGMDAREAAVCVLRMAGPHRLPDMLTLTDRMARRDAEVLRRVSPLTRGAEN